MKVRKEQFLLPKGKAINTSAKWIQPSLKTGEIAKSVSCTCFPSQPTSVEPLPSSALITKIKPDMLLSSGDIIVSGQPGGQLFWQQQNGILRQALLTEKDVKSEEKAMEVESGGQTAANTPAVLTLTPVPAAQVIKMSDYKVIVANEPLPVAWQGSGKKNNSLSMSTLPPIKPKVNTNASLQPVRFTAISNVNVLAPNQFPTFMIKDVKNTLPTNLVLSSPLMAQNSAPKKLVSKSIPKVAKVRKKPITAKKIMLKPPSSLLSQTALARTNRDKVIESLKDKSDGKSCASESSGNKILTENAPNDSIVQNHTKVEIPGNELPTSASKIFIETHTNNPLPFSSSLELKATESELTLSNIAAKTDFTGSLNSVQSTESQLTFESSTVNVVGHSIDDGGVIMTSDGQTVDNLMMNSDKTVICADGQTLLDTGIVVEPNYASDNSESNANLIRSDDFHTDHVETILPSDIEHHDEHHMEEYTDKLLSQLQLTNPRVLPNISSSQVSSVLNALAPEEINTFTSAKNDKEPVKCEPTEFVKIESLQIPNAVKVLKAKVPETKYRLCELNNHTCYRCVSCTFLSARREVVERHWTQEHRAGRSELLDRQLTRRQIRCLGCDNVVYSKYALQIHLLCDHNVVTTEVHELIATTLAANKAQRDVKRPSNLKPASSAKTKDVVVDAESNKEVTVEVSPSAVFQPDIPSEPVASVVPAANFVSSEPAKVDDEKLNEETPIPPTPSFSLFSDIQLPNDKEESVPPDEVTPEGEDSKKLMNSKKCARRLRRTERSKLKCETMYKFKCMVDRCGVRFTTAANLSYHLRCHRPDTEAFHCPECDTVVAAWLSLASHLWRCHNTDVDLYCCKLCGYKCNSYSKLINQHIKIHGDERPFLCDICGKGFKTTKQLRNHKAVHRARRLLGEGRGCYTCKVCGRGFADARILRHHTENVHNKLRPYMCTFCSHTASSKSSLMMHIRSHTGEKPFSCDECTYETGDHNSLRRHKMRHSGLRPYQCPHCSYNCIQATTYKAHLKNKHPGMDEGSLLFSCSMCPFRTIKKDNFLAHNAEHLQGDDTRVRRRKPLPPSNEDTLASCKNATQVLPDVEPVVLLEDSDDVQGAIEFIVPETD